MKKTAILLLLASQQASAATWWGIEADVPTAGVSAHTLQAFLLQLYTQILQILT